MERFRALLSEAEGDNFANAVADPGERETTVTTRFLAGGLLVEREARRHDHGQGAT